MPRKIRIKIKTSKLLLGDISEESATQGGQDCPNLDPSGEGKKCSEDEKCPPGYVCFNGKCVAGCVQETSAGAAGAAAGHVDPFAKKRRGKQ